MPQNYKKKIYILGGICLFLLAVTLVLSQGMGKRQILKQKAFTASGPVTLSLSPGSGNITQTGTTVLVQMTSSVSKQIMGAEVVLQLDADAASRFEVSSAACSSTFPYPAQAPSASGNRVTLTCSVNGGSPAVNLGAATLGSFLLKAKTGASAGTGIISFVSANLPEAGGTFVDLSRSGTSGTFTIASAGTVTPTPTLTQTPTPTVTPGGPTATPTATLTPTVTPGGPTLSPTPTCQPGAWDVNGCRRCLSNSVWTAACSDFGRWGNPVPTPNDREASITTYCNCARECYTGTTTPIPSPCRLPDCDDRVPPAIPVVPANALSCSPGRVVTPIPSGSPTRYFDIHYTFNPVTTDSGCSGLPASPYFVQMADNSLFTNPQGGFVSQQQTPIYFAWDLVGGRYVYIRVRTIDRYNNQSGWSEVRSVRLNTTNCAVPTSTPTQGACITCPAGRPAHNLGNANCNYAIDRTDLNLWVNRHSSADFNCNGQVDRDDLSKWIANFGTRTPTPTPR